MRATLDTSTLILHRENLPAMKSSEAGLIAERRAKVVLESLEGEASFAWLHRESGRDCPLWLCAVPTKAGHESHAYWSGRGVDVAMLASRQLALGHLIRMLPEAPESGLAAILNLDTDSASCVIADRDGWVFGREFPLHDISDLGGDEDESERGEQEPAGVPGFGLVDIWAMRLSTEMRRTFRYVEGELALGTVTRLWVAGPSARIAEICPMLETRLEMPSTPVGDAIPGSPSNAAAVAIGLALWPNDTGGNLLPQSLMKARARRVARRHLVVALGSVVSMLIAATAAMALFGNGLAAHIGELEAEFEATRADRAIVAQHEQIRVRASRLDEVVAGIDHPIPSLSGLLVLLSRSTPDNVYIERIRVAHASEGWTLSLELEAAGSSVLEAASAASGLADALKKSPLAKLDRVVQEQPPGMLTLPGEQTHVRFRLDGRLAPLGVPAGRSAASPPNDGGSDDA